jgi:DNA-binding MarR family transcriptional regulator
MSRDRLIEQAGEAVRLFQNAVDQVDEAAVNVFGINRTDARCLDLIDMRGRITAGELARASGLTTGSVTAVLDRMERAGFVRRVRDDEDRRRVYVELTPEARRRIAEVYGPIAEEGAALSERYTDEQLETIRAYTTDGTELLLKHVARIRGLAEKARGRRR